jgi:hypothetical protein
METVRATRAFRDGVHRCAAEFGKQRLIAKQQVCFIRIDTWPQSVALEQSNNPCMSPKLREEANSSS